MAAVSPLFYRLRDALSMPSNFLLVNFTYPWDLSQSHGSRELQPTSTLWNIIKYLYIPGQRGILRAAATFLGNPDNAYQYECLHQILA